MEDGKNTWGLDSEGRERFDDEFLNAKATEIMQPLCGMSIAQAEAVLIEARAVLKNSVFLSEQDVEAMKKRFALSCEQQG